ncbi:hypothetical protein M0R45_033225 [Rubus argutus]|uniref:Uncharacterized protein n=1 Tax=Rubus argutus TaxID=59490 RepID=A0AAW1WJX5_RUBAR
MGAGNRRHSVILVLLASTLMMLVATSHCMMSTTTTTASNSTVASSAWCVDGQIVDGQCILIAHANGGGEQLEYLDLDVMDRMVVEYDDSGEASSRRVLDVAGKINIYRAVRSRGEFCYDQKGQRYTCLNTPNKGRRGCRNLYNRDCQM